MKSFTTTIRLAALASLMLAATQAFAVECTPGPQCVDTVVVTAQYEPTFGEIFGAGRVGGGGGGGGGGSGSTPPAIPISPGLSTRQEPGCGRETHYQNLVDSALRAGNLQGNPIMQGVPITDPNLTIHANDWVKYQINAFSINPFSPTTMYWFISLHYEYSPSTGKFTSPPHFNGSAVQGCANGG